MFNLGIGIDVLLALIIIGGTIIILFLHSFVSRLLKPKPLDAYEEVEARIEHQKKKVATEARDLEAAFEFSKPHIIRSLVTPAERFKARFDPHAHFSISEGPHRIIFKVTSQGKTIEILLEHTFSFNDDDSIGYHWNVIGEGILYIENKNLLHNSENFRVAIYELLVRKLT